MGSEREVGGTFSGQVKSKFPPHPVAHLTVTPHDHKFGKESSVYGLG